MNDFIHFSSASLSGMIHETQDTMETFHWDSGAFDLVNFQVHFFQQIFHSATFQGCSHAKDPDQAMCFQSTTIQYWWACVHGSLSSWLREVEPNVVSSCCRPSTSRSDMMCILRWFSACHNCTKLVSELCWPYTKWFCKWFHCCRQMSCIGIKSREFC